MTSQHHKSKSIDPLLKLQNVSLNYRSIKALNNIKLTINKSEIHVVIGDIGAGKTSIAKIIGGVEKPTNGEIYFNGKRYGFLTLKKARTIGIETLYQEINLTDQFTVAENLFLPYRPSTIYHKKKCIVKKATELLSYYGFDINPKAPLKELAISDRVIIYLLKYIDKKPLLTVIDETIEKLPIYDFTRIVSILKKLKDKGGSVLLISHRINDIYNFADRVTILKNGEILLTDSINNIDKINLIRMTYTQISKNANYNIKDFYQLLKYNEAILENLPVNLIVTDRLNKVKMVNNYGKNYFNLNNISYYDYPFKRLFLTNNKKNQGTIETLLIGLQKKEEKMFYNMPLIINGQTTINNIRIYPIFDGTYYIGNIIIIENITEQVRLREQIILSEKLASVGLLAAGVAHEINNPLEIIVSCLRYIRYNKENNDFQETIDNIQEEINYISNIVNNLLNFSDKNRESIEEFNLNILIKEMVNLITFSAKHKEIDVFFNTFHDYIQIKANKNEMKQVILNLLKNSIEAMQNGGQVKIITDITSHNNNDFINIKISDTGYGIKDEELNNIFLPFYSTKNGNGNNLGLGLSVSYGIIKKYNGEISVRNLKPSGCEFEVKIPQ
jgi:signal transduction histidine kinase/ABC-type branched-subunit amino acid transport system ATPase component